MSQVTFILGWGSGGDSNPNLSAMLGKCAGETSHAIADWPASLARAALDNRIAADFLSAKGLSTSWLTVTLNMDQHQWSGRKISLLHTKGERRLFMMSR